jgi:broad specificity phosphatase PhoE
MKRLYFIRHGLSQGNIDGVWSGTIDTPLSPLGKKQAKLAGQKAKKLKIDYMISSPLSRALDTATIVAKAIGYPKDKIHINKLFIERHFGELEGKQWSPDLNLDGITDIETVDTLLERARLALDYIKTLKEENILIVSHGSFGRALRSNITGEKFHNQRPPKKALLPNAEVIRWL